MKVLNVLLVPVVCLLTASSGMAAMTPSIQNATIESRSAATGLEPVIREIIGSQSKPAWVGYAVPMRPGCYICCEGRGSGCRCRLEREESMYQQTTSSDSLDLVIRRHLLVLFRIADGEVTRIRSYSDECELDAGGRPFIWLTDVSPEQSVDWLATFVTARAGKSHRHDDMRDRALSTIAFHDDQAAFAMLSRFVDPGQPEKLREQAIFWIGESGGRQGVDLVNRVLRDDPSQDVREQAVFALTLTDDPEALESLIHAARTNEDPEIRANAIFWLGNKAGEKAAAAIADMAVDDPDTDVKEKAVFALSQLPPDEGVPRLIQVARTNRNPKVREQAIFWLGQSEDERALDFFEEVLTH